MGYVLTAIVVDENSLRGSLGSGDRRLFAKVIRRSPDDFDDDDYPHGYDGVTEREALADLIDRGDDRAYSHINYVYAFELLASTLGNTVFADRYDVDALDRNAIFDRPFPFQIPNDGSLPRLAFFSTRDLEQEVARARSGTECKERELWISCLEEAQEKRHAVLLTYG
jgi:hypothetical protein